MKSSWIQNAFITVLSVLSICSLPGCILNKPEQSDIKVSEQQSTETEPVTLKENTSIQDDMEQGVIWETNLSEDGTHSISTVITRDKGINIVVDGTEFFYNDIVLRYCPSINNKGQYLWAQHSKGYGYDIILCGDSVLHSGACLDFCRIGDSTAMLIESDIGEKLTRIYVIVLDTCECDCVACLNNEYIEECRAICGDRYGIITSSYSETGDKAYHLYHLDAKQTQLNMLIGEVTDLMTFGKHDENCEDSGIVIDLLKMSDNDRLLYNAIKIDQSQKNEAFAYGNDFRGRLSWSESERLRGLCELYKKTGDAELYDRIIEVADGILAGRNANTGIPDNEWNPAYLWASKAYSIKETPVSIIIENGEILSALLLACNEGVISKDLKAYQDIIWTAEKAFAYYDQWYADGHYSLPYGYPATTDGIIVPWNYQNSMAEMALSLYIETGNERYLNRCEDLIRSFKDEWIEEEDRVYWHYWPNAYYSGWSEESSIRSLHLPTKEKTEDTLFEDASHAGISVRMLYRYTQYFPDGVICSEDIDKIESNMRYFCCVDGFSRFISGDTEYVPKAWHYWISPYFSYLQNEAYYKYVRQGYLKCFPAWDSQESLFCNAKLYDPTIPSEGVVIVSYHVDMCGNIEMTGTSKTDVDYLKY